MCIQSLAAQDCAEPLLFLSPPAHRGCGELTLGLVVDVGISQLITLLFQKGVGAKKFKQSVGNKSMSFAVGKSDR